MFQNKIGQIWVVLALLASLSLACGLIDISQATPTIAPPPQWIAEWLENPLCQPPCWESIQPGVTPIDATQNIKQKYPYVSFETKRDSPIIRMISLNLALTDNLPVELLISKFGLPTHMRIYKCDPNVRCETHVIFIDIGMVLNLYPIDLDDDNITNTVEISANTPVYNVYLMEPGLENYLTLFSGKPSDLVQWNNFGTYSNSP